MCENAHYCKSAQDYCDRNQDYCKARRNYCQHMQNLFCFFYYLFLFWCNESAGSMREQLPVFAGYCQEIIDRCSSAWCLSPSTLWLMDDKSQSDFHSNFSHSALLPHSLTARVLPYVYSCSHACTSQILPYIFSTHSVLTGSQMPI